MRTDQVREDAPAASERWGPLGGVVTGMGRVAAHPATALVAVGLIVLLMAWQFLVDASRAVPALDTAWYQWRAEYLRANDPGSLLGIEGADGSLAGGYRVAEPVLAGLLRIVAGVGAEVPTVVLSVFFRVAAAAALAAFAWRHRRSRLLYYLTLAVVPSLFLLQRFFGFLDNFFALALTGVALLLLEPMRTSWVARLAVIAMLFLMGLTHPTTLALFLLALGAVAGYQFLREGFSLRAALGSDVTPMLWAGVVAVVLMFLAWLGGMWGPSAGLNEAAVPPPQPVSYFVDRSINVFRGMQPLTLVPLFLIGFVALAVDAWRRRERFAEIGVAWDLPLIGMLGFLLGAAYPYFRFFNATLAPLLTVAVGFAAIIGAAARLRRRGLAQVAAVVAVAATVGILASWWIGGLSSWNRGSTWLKPDVRTSLAAISGYLEAEPEGRAAVVLVDAQPEGVVPYGRYKEFANALYAGIPGDRIDDTAPFFGRVEDLEGRAATSIGDEQYDALAGDSADEALPLLEREAVVLMPLIFNEPSENEAYLDGCEGCRELGESDVYVLPDLSTAAVSEEAVSSGARAAAEARAFAESPPGPFENLGSTLLSLLGTLLLLVLPGWLLWRGLPGRDPIEGIALVPMLSVTLVTTVGVVALGIIRGPLTPVVGWSVWVVSVGVAAPGGTVSFSRTGVRMEEAVSKRYDEQVSVEQDGGLPAAFLWRGRRHEVSDVIGRWRIEGRWWEDGRDREYWRVEARGGAVFDLFLDRRDGRWRLERLWD